MLNSNTIKKLSRTSLFTLLMAGTLLAQSGTAATFKFSDFTFTRATVSPTNEFHNKVFYQTQKTTTDKKGKSTTVTTDVKGVAAFQQFVQQESSAIDLNTLNARKLDSTKLKLTSDRKINIYFIDEGAGYRNQLKLVTVGGANGTNKDGLVFYDGSRGTGANELQAGDYVSVGHNLTNSDVVKAGTILDFQLRANGFDTSNNTSRSSADVWYTDKTKNVDKLQHVIAYEYQGFLVLAWEDLNGGGDKDYNDIVFAVDIGQANLDAIPSEPPANQAPNAMPDAGSTNYNSPADINVLANDTDPEGQALTITGATSLTGATVQVVNGKVRYTPKSDFNIAGGSDSFSYTIKDPQGATSSATVTISVGAKPIPLPVPKQNQAPVALNDNELTPNNTPVIIDVLANDIDPEGQAITITDVNSTTGATVAIVNGKVQYTPRSNSNKIAARDDSFTYTIKDSQGATASATVTVTVGEQANKPPVAQAHEVSTPKKTPVIVDVMFGASDPDGDPVTLESVSSSIGANVQIDKVNGQVIYTPKFTSNQAASESFTYTIKDSDGAISSPATVTVNVGANKAPDAVNDQMSTAYGAPKTVDVLANDIDPDDQDFQIKSVNSTTGATVEVIDGKVLYTPKSDFNKAGGTDTFTYIIEDIQGATDSATVTISVGKKPNGAPTAVDDKESTPYGTPVTVNVLVNDSDPENDKIMIDSVKSDTGATVQLTTTGQVIYTPKSDFNTAGDTDKFTYTIKDEEGNESSASVTVTVQAKPSVTPPTGNGNLQPQNQSGESISD